MTFTAASGILVLHTSFFIRLKDLIYSLVLNFVGVKITSIVTNLGMITEVVMTLGIGTLILIKKGPHQSSSILFSNETTNGPADSWAFLTAMLSPVLQLFISHSYRHIFSLDLNLQLMFLKRL